MKLVITGATGFIGAALVDYLVSHGHNLVLLVRKIPSKSFLANVSISLWDGRTVSDWCRHIDEAETIINLAGEPIGHKRWNESQKKEIVGSRINATRAIVEAVNAADRRPRLLINASAIGFYGDRGDSLIDESAAAGKGFLAETCVKWEKEALAASSANTRVVLMRTGVVLDKDGGALARMAAPFKLFAGGPPGSGKQWVSWIHRQDVIRAIDFIIANPKLTGPVNITAPEPVTMRQLSAYLGEAMGRPSWVTVPEFVIKGMLGEMSELVLSSQRILPKKLMEAGFSFTYTKVNDALRAIFTGNRPGQESGIPQG